MSRLLKSTRPQWLLFFLFIAIVIVDCMWFSLDQRPPIWDMAVHLATAYDFWNAFHHFSFSWGFLKSLLLLGKFYPTLFPALMGIFFLLFHPSIYVGPAANFIPLAILMLATYRMGRKLFSESVGVLAGFLVATYPMTAWLVREALLDLTLMACVALAAWLYLESENFSRTRTSFFYGIAVALGFLAKHGFLFYGFVLGLFALFEITRRDEEPLRKRSFRLRNMIMAHLVGLAGMSLWYIPHWDDVREYFQINRHLHYVLHQPEFMTAPSMLYTLDALTGTQMLFGPFVLLVFALIISLRRFARRAMILYFGGFGSLVIMTFAIVHREVRMGAASLPFFAVLTAAGILELRTVGWRRGLTVFLVACSLFEFELITFGWPRWSDTIPLFRSRAIEVNLFERQYSHIVGPPEREDWQIEPILTAVADDAVRKKINAPRLGIVPDLPRFNHSDFILYSRLGSIPVSVNRLFQFSDKGIPPSFNYMVVKSGDQGEPGTTPSNVEINQYVLQHPHRFQKIGTFALPDGSQAVLYRCNRSTGAEIDSRSVYVH